MHPRIADALISLRQGRINRREFLRLATLLGVSYATARHLAACGPLSPQSPPALSTTSFGIKRGGRLRIGAHLFPIGHPAQLAWPGGADVLRQVYEYLTLTDRNNITHPLLLESWSASGDLTVWTLNLRRGIHWSNGDEFSAEDVLYNFSQWLDPDVAPAMVSLLAGFLALDGVEVLDNYTVRLNLERPKLDIPENLFHYSALVMHRDFDGDPLSTQNPNTGPYTLQHYRVGESARLARRENYWQMGADEQLLPYLDVIEFVDLGHELSPYIRTLETGQIDAYQPGIRGFIGLRNAENVKINATPSAQARVLRFQVDQPPWDDYRVRLAVKKLQPRDRIHEQAYNNLGTLAHDVHVAPVHPEFVPLELPDYDPEGARALLEAAGIESLDFEIAVGEGWRDAVVYAEALREAAAEIGVEVDVLKMPEEAYREQWQAVAVGITPWTHYPLALMGLQLAYGADDAGNPLPWNESCWVDAEFQQLLRAAQGTLDLEARRAIVAELERIQSERGSIAIAYWMNVWEAYNPAFQNLTAHPSGYRLLNEVWYDPGLDPFGVKLT